MNWETGTGVLNSSVGAAIAVNQRTPQIVAELERMEKLIEELTISQANFLQRIGPVVLEHPPVASGNGQAESVTIKSPLAERLNRFNHRLASLLQEQQCAVHDIDI